MTTFSVTLQPLGRTILADAERPVLDAALAGGLNLPHSCKSGHCTSCRAQLRSGEIAYPGGRRPAGLMAHEAAAGRVLLCQARARSDLVLEVRPVFRAGADATTPDVAAPAEIRRLPCRIDEKRLLAPDVMQLFLRLPAVERLPFQPGQYLDVILGDARRRSFSIASPPHDAARPELHVRRAPGGGFTGALFDAMPVGTLLKIEGPIGQFAYAASAAPLLLVAGGTGFAPLKSILRHVLEVEGTTRPVHLYWGARTPDDVYEHGTVCRWAAEHSNLRYVPVLSTPEASAALPPGMAMRAGWVHQAAIDDLGPELVRHDVYVAGPPALVEAVRTTFAPLGVEPGRIRFDSFDYAPR
jgi:CDP-4-dehydro-6-deoxyglucose reductase